MKKYRQIIALCLITLVFVLAGCKKDEKSQFSLIEEDEKLRIVYDAGADTPWGYSAGAIEGENGAEYMLLLPKCEISVKLMGTLESFEYSTMIHPWVMEGSDGAGFRVVVVDDKTNETVVDIQTNVNTTESFVAGQIPLSVSEGGSYTLKIEGNTGLTDDEACDWIVFEKLSITGEFEVVPAAIPPQVETEDYLIAANYFCGGWPKTMWDCIPDDVEGDFSRMLDDGFNTVIILVPWRQFQPSISPISYNETAFSRLENIMATADNVGINVVLRIGYFHDFYQNGSTSELTERFSNVMIDGVYRDAFLEYAETVYKAISTHPSYRGAFVCWEDFWGPVNILKETDSKAIHLEYARKLGFQEYIESKYSLAQWNEINDTNYTGFGEILVPNVSHPAFRVFYEAYDYALNDLLYDVQQVVPNVSMEIRLDADLVTCEDGSQEYYSHEITYGCGESDYVATVYGIPMGCENQGERLTAEQALEKTEYILQNLNNKTNNKSLFVEQFLFYDDTAEFSYNARLELDQITPYLRQVHNILRQNTCGIGIWTYQNYLFNSVYNSQFDEGLQGWDSVGNVHLNSDGTSSVALPAGSSIVQQIYGNRTNFADGAVVKLRFTVCDESDTTIIGSIGCDTQSVTVNGSGVYEMEFTYTKQEMIPLTIKTTDTVELDNIILYHHVQNGLLYDEYGKELDNIEDMRALIANLKNYGAEA